MTAMSHVPPHPAPDVEFFWDPVCPWAWITSCWVREVQRLRGLDVDWRFISLRMVNEGRPDADYPASHQEVHDRGLRLLRVAAAVRADHGRGVVGELYRAYGHAMHNERDRARFDEPAAIVAVLRGLDLPGEHADAATSTAFDDVIRLDTTAALERCGGNVGTPVISWSPPDGASFFGPVISKAPKGDEALRLWDAISELGANPWFSELKRSTRSAPQFD
jgi:2-hydroxychromene-2-carboxylate isomerase